MKDGHSRQYFIDMDERKKKQMSERDGSDA
jgi:hypothetical protein